MNVYPFPSTTVQCGQPGVYFVVCVCVQLFSPCGYLHAVIITDTSRWIELATYSSIIPLLSGCFVSNHYAPLFIIPASPSSFNFHPPHTPSLPMQFLSAWRSTFVGGLASYCIATWSVPARGSSWALASTSCTHWRKINQSLLTTLLQLTSWLILCNPIQVLISQCGLVFTMSWTMQPLLNKNYCPHSQIQKGGCPQGRKLNYKLHMITVT